MLLNFPADPLRLPSPSSLPLFNIMLPWEEDPDEGLKTFLLRCACGPPSISRNLQTRLCSMDRLCTAILKSKNLPFLPHLAGTGGVSRTCLAVFKVTGPRWALGSAVKSFKVSVLPLWQTFSCCFCCCCCCFPISHEGRRT